MARVRLLERVQFVPRPLPEVFAFFADAGNLERITPGFLRFRVLTPLPVPMAPGTLIDYRLSLFGIPFRWTTRIDAFEPGRGFTDSQLRGPYARWVHAHEFHEAPGGTLIVDRVEWAVPPGLPGELARALFVERTLDRIFGYRRERVGEILGGPAADGARLECLAPAPGRL